MMMKDEILAMIASVRAEYPDLSANGWRYYSRSITADQFEAWRDEMTTDDCVGQFVRAQEFLRICNTRKACDRKATSYGRKHLAERWHRSNDPRENPYVSNGMFIAAAIVQGVPIVRIPGSPNCFFGLSRRSISQIDRGIRSR